MALMCIYIEAEPSPTQPKPSQAKRVYEDRCAKHRYQSGMVPRNKASHLQAQAKPSHAQRFSELSQAKPSLIYKYTKKGVLLKDKVGPCSTSSTPSFNLSVSRRYGVIPLRCYRTPLMMCIFILRQGQTNPNQTKPLCDSM